MEINGYNLSRDWFDWCFLNPEKIKPVHTALYFFCIEQCNRLGWKPKFGLPTDLAKETIGVKSYNTYIGALTDLAQFGFIEFIEKSKNQYSSNIIALSNFDKAIDKALDKALVKHMPKQSESTCQSIDSIDKQLNNKTINNKTIKRESEFENSVLNFFGFSDFPHHHKQQSLLSQFCCAKIISGEYEYFKSQFKAYSNYILTANKQQYQQSIYTFLGNPSSAFDDGKWNAENWSHKLGAQLHSTHNHQEE
jgi:hypothetical protein